jgi:hypothetical protein
MSRKRRAKMPRPRGEFGFTVPQAGEMIGLSRNSAYAAAKAGRFLRFASALYSSSPRPLGSKNLASRKTAGRVTHPQPEIRKRYRFAFKRGIRS